MLYSCNKNNNVSALDYILDSNFGSVQGRGTPMKLGFGSPKKRGEDPWSILSTIQPVENIGDVLHDENVLKSYMYSVTY